jgi:hypothetical protein
MGHGIDQQLGSNPERGAAAARDRIFGKDVERVGVIIVHGIGEQKRYEFLEGETRKIVEAIVGNYGERRRDVTPTLATGSGDAFLGAHSSWISGGKAPLHCLVELDDKVVDIAFHEVWWADINEPLTLGKQIRFWAWGLSLAGIAEHNTPFLRGTTDRTRPPQNHGVISVWNRIRVLYVSVLFGLSALSVALVNVILKRLDFKPFPLTSTIVNYLSGVKIYSQDKRAGGSPMDGPDEPPRFAIRRRMIRVLGEVAIAGYDRWYILAHSLGTVVAWNGLMEIQQALPNYLDRTCWNSPEASPLRGRSAAPFDTNGMLPNRPLWLDNREIIERDALFERFRGILTYGSPLERFCALWSAMVPINKKEDVFRTNAEWVNVYDPTDPVGTWLKDYDPEVAPPARQGFTKLTPENFPCRASPVLLASHLAYLNAPKKRCGKMPFDSDYYLINQVAHWLVRGDSLRGRLHNAPQDSVSFWMPRGADQQQTRRRCLPRVIGAFAQEVAIGLLLTALTVLSINWVILPVMKGVGKFVVERLPLTVVRCVTKYYTALPSRPGWLAEVGWLWLCALGVVIVASVVHRYLATNDRQDLIGRVREQTKRREKTHFN